MWNLCCFLNLIDLLILIPIIYLPRCSNCVAYCKHVDVRFQGETGALLIQCLVFHAVILSFCQNITTICYEVCSLNNKTHTIKFNQYIRNILIFLCLHDVWFEKFKKNKRLFSSKIREKISLKILMIELQFKSPVVLAHVSFQWNE